MKKIFYPILSTTALISGLAMPTATASALEANTDTMESPFLVTKINPTESTLSILWQGDETVSYINLLMLHPVFNDEASADAALPTLYKGIPWWSQAVYAYSASHVVGGVHKGVEINFASSDLRTSLTLDTNHKLYYSINLGGENYVRGKLDYGGCVNSDAYQVGATCQAEASEDGGLQYWPYLNGVRLANNGGESEESGGDGSGTVDGGENGSEGAEGAQEGKNEEGSSSKNGDNEAVEPSEGAGRGGEAENRDEMGENTGIDLANGESGAATAVLASVQSGNSTQATDGSGEGRIAVVDSAGSQSSMIKEEGANGASAALGSESEDKKSSIAAEDEATIDVPALGGWSWEWIIILLMAAAMAGLIWLCLKKKDEV